MKGFNVGEFADVVDLVPLREAAGRIQVGLACVAVVELGGEKVADALGDLRSWREEEGGNTGRREGRYQVLGHFSVSGGLGIEYVIRTLSQTK